MKKILLLIIMAFLLGCQQKNDFEETLTKNHDSTYWNQKIVSSDGVIKYTNNQWIFYPDGTSMCLVSFNEHKKGSSVIINMEGSDLYKWRFRKGDNILRLYEGENFKVTKYSTDSIWLNSIPRNEIILLTREWISNIQK